MSVPAEPQPGIRDATRRAIGRHGTAYWCAAAIIAAAGLWWAFRDVDLRAVGTTLGEAHLELLAAAAVSVTASYALRASRWLLLLRSECPVAWTESFWATNAGYLGNNLLPARAGEPLRSYLLARATGNSTSYVFATAIVERLLDVAGLLLVAGTCVLLVPGIPEQVALWVGVFGLIAGAGVALLLLGPTVARRLAGVLPSTAAARLHPMLEQFALGTRTIASGRVIVGSLAYTGAIWLFDVGAALLVAAAFGITFGPTTAIVLIAGLAAASTIPSTPGYLGVYQATALVVLVPLGIDPVDALAIVIALQAVTVVVSIAWGIVGINVLVRRARCRPVADSLAA